MREIKFRAWIFNLLEMRNDVHLLDGLHNIISMPEKYHLMQFTGLKDKNGKEIYEGDILCWPEYEGTKNQGRWVVEWDSDKARFTEWSPRHKAEVIGNLYENPNLIK